MAVPVLLSPLSAAALCLAVLACFLTARRARRAVAERDLWRRTAWAAALATGTAVGVSALGAAGAPAALGGALLVVAWTAVFVLLYGALVRWNRYPTALADPHDVLNGVSSVLAATALLDTALRLHWGAAAAAGWWELVARGLPAVVLLICLGTAASLPSLAGLQRDPRFWLVTSALAAGVAAAAAWLAGLGSAATPTTTAWVAGCAALAAACLGAASLVDGEAADPRPTDPAASTRGAFSVLLTGLLTLVVGHVVGISGVAVLAAGGAVVGTAVRLRNNLTDLAHLAVARRLAHTDDLTGLANRRALLVELAARHAAGRPLLLALLDLDRFKEVNDGLGHAAGDDLIAAVAERLTVHLPPSHLLARLGGDEFAVLLDAAPGPLPLAEQAAELGHAVTAAMAAPFALSVVSLHVSASVGLATSAGSGAPGEAAPGAAELLRRADAAMYQAKRSGTHVAVSDAEAHARSSGEVLLVEDLRAALVGGGLVLHHQPQLSATTGAVSGVEALVRWQHPQRGLLPPGAFLPSAEAHGLMGALSEVVLGLAVAQLAQWEAQGLRLRMSVNLSASNLLDTSLPQGVAELLHHHGVAASALVLEVTESVLISDPERSLAVLAELADLGVGLSIDDYGTGYSSLTYLQRLPVHELKLDRSFTSDLHGSARARAVVASTVDLAHALGLRVVAEGVEDERTLRQLVELGCDETQGWLHAPALPAEELRAWVQAREVGARQGGRRRTAPPVG